MCGCRITKLALRFPFPYHGLSYERFCFMKYTIMSKLLEMLANGNRKIAMTIDSEDLMSYVQGEKMLIRSLVLIGEKIINFADVRLTAYEKTSIFIADRGICCVQSGCDRFTV